MKLTSQIFEFDGAFPRVAFEGTRAIVSDAGVVVFSECSTNPSERLAKELIELAAAARNKAGHPPGVIYRSYGK